MKKLLLVFATCLPFLAQAQETKEPDSTSEKRGIKEFTLGIMVTSLASRPFDKGPFLMSWTFAPSLNILTSHTHDHIMFDVGNNTIETLNGFLLPRTWDVYTFLSENLTTSQGYGSIGIEKVLPVHANFEFVFFGEVGTDFKGTNSVTFGLVMHPYFSLLPEKKK